MKKGLNLSILTLKVIEVSLFFSALEGMQQQGFPVYALSLQNAEETGRKAKRQRT